MTAPATEKAAPIPAVADAAKALLDDLWSRGGYGSGQYEHAIQRRRFEAAYPKAVELERALADRAPQAQRIREDERAETISCLEEVVDKNDGLTKLALRYQAQVRAAEARADTAAEDERDRLFALIDGDGFANSGARAWFREQGAMLPADRARLRGGAS